MSESASSFSIMEDSQIREVIESIESVSASLMLKEPFYAMVLLNLNKGVSDEGPTAWVRLDGTTIALEVNPWFWEELNDKQKLGVLKHELLHVCFGHLTETFERLNSEDAEMANIAMDITVNQHIDKTWLIKGACTLEWFNKMYNLNMKPFQSCIYYYDILKKHAKKILLDLSGGKNGGKGEKKDEEDEKKGKGKGDGNGAEGFSENDVPDLPGMHSTSEEDAELLEGQINKILKEVSEEAVSRGIVPLEMEDTLENLKRKPREKVDWRGFLRKFVGSAESEDITTTRRKINYRYEDNPGFKHKKKVRVLGCIDTSASVSDLFCRNFIEQLFVISDRGAEVDILQFDAIVQDVSPLKKLDVVKLKGRGGTNFQPPFDYYFKHRNEYDCMVIITDGYAPAPEVRFGAAKVLWLIWNEGAGAEEFNGWRDHKGVKLFLTDKDID